MITTIKEYTQMAQGDTFNHVASVEVILADGSEITLVEGKNGLLQVRVRDGILAVMPVSTNLILVKQVKDDS
jgi:hypothetical protein